MKIRRIDDNTLSCIITPEDLREQGIRIDDFFERKKEAVDFIRSAIARAAVSENFNMAGEMMTMRISVLPDHSLSLLISREDSRSKGIAGAREYVKKILESLSEEDKESDEGGTAQEDPLARLISDAAAAEDKADSGKEEREEKDPGAEKPAAKSFMFSFFTVRDAMECCRGFASMEAIDSSFYYLREDDTYFLILRSTEKTPLGFEKRVLSANEFGELVTSNDQYISFVTEHGICLAADHAVETFLNVMPGNMIPRVRRKKRGAGSQGSPSYSGMEEAEARGCG